MITVSSCLKLATFSPIQRQMSFAATVSDLDLFQFLFFSCLLQPVFPWQFNWVIVTCPSENLLQSRILNPAENKTNMELQLLQDCKRSEDSVLQHFLLQKCGINFLLLQQIEQFQLKFSMSCDFNFNV